MKLHLLLSLVAVFVMTTGLNALIGEVVQGAGDAVAGIGEGISNLGSDISDRGVYYRRDGYVERPVEQVTTTTTYNEGFLGEPVKEVTTEKTYTTGYRPSPSRVWRY